MEKLSSTPQNGAAEQQENEKVALLPWSTPRLQRLNYTATEVGKPLRGPESSFTFGPS